ncbi:MAG: hypothetical protein HN712_01325 [Gemmatimonadetes bacterium]|nr:hypothetical protein [Gemmatimonadota bacterium]MBT6145411.1 hypothetical protein [Gemmatimonadota bacterium]MBT7858913.1 hypothetical protein [Gemmatimonadota bacterium]
MRYLDLVPGCGPVAKALLLGVMGVTLSGAASPNLATDAMSRATTYHSHTGNVSLLADGLVPPEAGALAFEWSTQGIITFDWEQVTLIEAVRLRVGSLANDYVVRTFIGGHLLDEGATREPMGELTASVLDVTRVVDGWVQVDLPAGTRADNLELHSLGPVQLYEIEILTPAATVISTQGWAHLKMPEGLESGARGQRLSR